jgi:predicted metal-binding protein
MNKKIKIGIIICERYKNCAGGKCFRALKKREGAFDIYDNQEIELAAFTTCGGCPGGNIEYTPEEMKKNGVQKIHFATGMIVGYPPCPYIAHFKEFIEKKYDIDVVVGTHPIPEIYYETHKELGTWKSAEWQEIIQPALNNKETREAYN